MDHPEDRLGPLLESLSAGDRAVLPELAPLVQAALLAAAGERLPIDPGGARRLVATTWERVGGAHRAHRVHFCALAASQVRRVMVDRARASLESASANGQAAPHALLLAIHEALRELASRNELRARLIELVAFGGLDQAAAASALAVRRSTLERDWARAEAWLAGLVGPSASQNGAHGDVADG